MLLVYSIVGYICIYLPCNFSLELTNIKVYQVLVQTFFTKFVLHPESLLGSKAAYTMFPESEAYFMVYIMQFTVAMTYVATCLVISLQLIQWDT